MAHRIMNNRNMAFSGATPWHGLGKQITDPTNVDLCLQEAGLDWTVRLEDAYWKTPEGKGRKIPNLFHVMGQNDTVYQTVSERYHVIQNSDILEMFRDYAEKGHLTIETLGALNNGNIVWALAKYGDSYKVGADIHNSYALLSTSHDGSLAFSGKMTDVRVVCNNTLQMASPKTGATKTKHTANWRENSNGIKDALKIQDQQVREHRMKLEEYFDTKVTRSETPVIVDLVTRFKGAALVKAITEVGSMEVDKGNVLDAIVDRMNLDADVKKTVGNLSDMDRLGKAILDVYINDDTMPANKTNGYGVLQAVTRQLDHFAGYNADSRMRSAQFGGYAKVKQQTVSLIDTIVMAN